MQRKEAWGQGMPCFTVSVWGQPVLEPNQEHSLPEESLKGGPPGQQLHAAPPGVGAFDMSMERVTPSPVARGCSAMLLLTSEVEEGCTSPSREELGGSYTLNLTQSCLP